MTSFAPTTEQQHALALFQTGESLAIEAGAGTGKTSTLLLLAESAPNRRGQYVAFNKAIVDESKLKFPRTVACNTAHSLAFRAVGKNYADRLSNSQRMKSWELAKILRLDPVTVKTFTGDSKTLSPSFLSGLVMRAVERFCQTADLEPTYRHVPLVDGLDAPATIGSGPQRYEANREVARSIERAVRFAWEDLRLYHGVLPYKHSHYLKAWQLSNPRIEADYILFDEAQDANPVMVAVIAAQEHAQLVWVGDSNQQIYSFTGAVNALQGVPADSRAFLTQSFRFGPAVADVANVFLADLNAPLRLTGTESIPSTVGPVDEPVAILTRTNAEAIRTVLDEIRDGGQPLLVGGGTEIASFARAAEKLMENPPRRVEHPELACFDSWGEVQEYVAFDQQGGDLRLMVNLIDEFGIRPILDALDRIRYASEQDATVIVSTAHKSKGREWDSVRLAADFPDEPGEEELRLLYVASTRAKVRLDLTAVGYWKNGVAA